VPEPGPHPGPPPDLISRAPRIREHAGPWFRLHSARHTPLHFGRQRRWRFDAPAAEFGVLYAADDLHGAFIETFGRQLDVRSITSQKLVEQRLATIESVRGLRLVDLAASGGLARLGADTRLTAGDYEVSQAWSRALWAHPVHADGLSYPLRHDPTRLGCAIFDRAAKVLTVTRQGTLWDPARRSELGGILDRYGFGLIVE
jgi:hypothetical protein